MNIMQQNLKEFGGILHDSLKEVVQGVAEAGQKNQLNRNTDRYQGSLKKEMPIIMDDDPDLKRNNRQWVTWTNVMAIGTVPPSDVEYLYMYGRSLE